MPRSISESPLEVEIMRVDCIWEGKRYDGNLSNYWNFFLLFFILFIYLFIIIIFFFFWILSMYKDFILHLLVIRRCLHIDDSHKNT